MVSYARHHFDIKKKSYNLEYKCRWFSYANYSLFGNFNYVY